MKKFIAALIVVALVLTSVVALVACDDTNKTEVEKAIEAAQGMTLAELEAASKKEMEEHPEYVFNADSLTSGIKNALNAFIAKYDWITADNAKYNSKKGSTYQPVLNAAVDAGNQYVADFVMIQDASFVDSLVRQGFLLSYVPSGEGFNIAAADQKPLVGVTFNKVFMFNTVGKEDTYLKNVWQLTGEDGATLEGRKNVSFQDPTAEDINMSFLVMLTSPEAVAKLTAAYKTYFGEDYDGSQDNYKNIGYKFVAEFWKNCMTHNSDTDEAKALAGDAYKGKDKIVFAGVAKFKDYIGVDETNRSNPQHEDYYGTAIGAAGLNVNVEGISGFTYNMWTLIPKTARLPYTACLFIRYILSEEGYEAGFGGNLGYYSANNNIAPAPGDNTLSQWKQVTIGEDFGFLRSDRFSVRQFVTGISK